MDYYPSGRVLQGEKGKEGEHMEVLTGWQLLSQGYSLHRDLPQRFE